jgi:hypothetical protein
VFRTSTSHEEGGERLFAVMTRRFVDEQGRVKALDAVKVRFGTPDASGRRPLEEIPGSEFRLPADLVLLALGFLGPVQEGLVRDLGVKLDARGNVAADANHMSSEPGIFVAGMVEGRDAGSTPACRAAGRGPLEPRGHAGPSLIPSPAREDNGIRRPAYDGPHPVTGPPPEGSMNESLFLQLEGKVKQLAERCRALDRERVRLTHLLEQKEKALAKRDREVASLLGMKKSAFERVDVLLHELNKLRLPTDGPET